MAAIISDFPYDPKKVRTVKVPNWSYPLLQSYNGFTGVERIRCWQLAKWSQNVGLLRMPSTCSISGVVGEGYGVIQYHSENYYDPFGAHEIHTSLHRTLHRRFYEPGKWNMVVDRYKDSAEDKWFVDLPMVEKNVARRLRATGINTNTMVEEFLRAIPSGFPKPFGKLLTIDDFNADRSRKRDNVSDKPIARGSGE